MQRLLLPIILLIIIIIGIFLFVKSPTVSRSKPQEVLSSYSQRITPSHTPSPSAIISKMSENNIASQEAKTIEKATIITEKGEIEIELYTKEAPRTVENFVTKAKSDFYKNLIFHRAEDWVIQGGDPLGNGTGGGNMPVEFNAKPFVVGSVGVASRGDGKVQNDAQFFITKKDAQWLNGQYTNFGIVTKGMDIVNKIEIGDKILSISVE